MSTDPKTQKPMRSQHVAEAYRKNPQLKRGSVLWQAVRKSMPVFVARPLRQRFRKQRAPRFMIDPETKPKMGWDMLVTCCVLYTTCVVPYRVCFKRDATGGFAQFETLLDVCFGADILLNFLTGVHLPSGEITYDERVVARAYLRGWFWVDFFSTIPFDDFASWFGVVSDSSSRTSSALASAKLLRSLKVLRLFKLARIRKLSKMFLSLEDAVFTNQSLLSLTKLALSMLFLSHLVACLWFVIGNHAPTAGVSTWVDEYAFGEQDAELQYLVSVYWAIVTMVTIGYGDILARNNLERIFAILIMALGVSFFGYVIGTISTLVSNLDVAAALYDERLTIVKEYIMSRGIPAHLSKRIRDHFEYYYQNRSVFKEKTVLERLPSAMRNEMIHHRHAKIVSNVTYFADCHESLVSDIVMAMRPFNVLKDEYVFVQHEIAAHVFFLLKGKIHLTKTVTVAMANGRAPGGEWRLAVLTVGEHFGELEVYDHEHGNGVRICSAIAKSYCELTFLSRQAISKISASWPEVLRHFKLSAKESSRRMRRRVDKPRGVRHHACIEEERDGDVHPSDSDNDDDDDDDDDNDDDADDGNGDGNDGRVASGGVAAHALFRDDEMETKMIKSTLLARTTMRANVKKAGGGSRVSPFVGPDDVQEHRIVQQKPVAEPPVTVESTPRQHSSRRLLTVITTTETNALHCVGDKGADHDHHQQRIVELLPTTDDTIATATTLSILDASRDMVVPASPLSPTSTPGSQLASAVAPQPTRGRLVLEALRVEKPKPVVGRSTRDSPRTEVFDGVVEASPNQPATTPEEDFGSSHRYDGVVSATAAKYGIQGNGVVDANGGGVVPSPSATSSTAGVATHAQPLHVSTTTATPTTTTTAIVAATTDAATATGVAPKTTAIHMISRMQLPRQSPVIKPRNTLWKKAAVTAVAVDKRSQDSRRNLNEILAKIRGSSSARPKPSFRSERAQLHGTYVFHPQERFILTWQFIVGIAILYSIIVVPYRLGFDAEALGGWLVLETVLDCFFGVDMLLNFRTAYLDEERVLVCDTKVIFWRYVKGWFVVDFVSTVPIDDVAKIFLSSGGDGSSAALQFFPTKLLRLFRVARLLKLARLIKLSRVAGRLRDLVQLSPSTERLTKLLLVMSLFCHWNACAFHAAMLASETAGAPSWCSEYFLSSSNAPRLAFSSSSSSSSSSASEVLLCSERVSREDRYIAAIYWAFTTFTTVGYGDIRPSMYSAYELALVILLIVINATVYGYIISAVVTLIKNLNPSDREYRLRMTEMKDYLRDSSVSVRLGAHIKAHYQHILMSTSLFPEEKLFDKMSPSLRFDIARLVAGETLFAIPLITVMEDSFKGFVSYALFLMKPLCILRSEKVCRSGGPGTEMFFLVEGQCDLVNCQTNEGCIIGTNAVFEQYSLMAQDNEIYRTVSTVTAISKKCILYSLAIQDFRVLEDVSPAVSTYFLSQLAAVLMEDELFALTPMQNKNVESALRNGRAFRAVAEKHEKARLHSVSTVAMAKLAAPRRKGSEWAPDLLPRLLNRMENPESADPDQSAGGLASLLATVSENSIQQETEM